MFIFMTHNEALMWSRFERVIAVVGGVCMVYLFESMGSQPTWLMARLSVLIAQILVLKCWADMIMMSEPDKNCWAFKS